MKQVNVAVVGAGDWGKNLIKNFYKTANLVGIYDSNSILAKQVAEKYNVLTFSWEEILSNKELDAVIIATTGSHYHLAKAVLLSNKHVFVEKPLATTTAEAKDLFNIATKFNKKLMVGHLLQYHPAFIELKKLCSNNYLGKILYAYSNRLAFGKFMPEEDVLINLAPHDISMMLSLFGKPRSISTFANCFLSDQDPDQATIHLNFDENQFGHIFISWFHPIKERKLVVIGSKAIAVFDDLANWEQKLAIYHHDLDLNVKQHKKIANLLSQNLKIEFIEIAQTKEPLWYESEHFIKCIQNDLIPKTDGNEALAVIDVIEQANFQLKTGQNKSSKIKEPTFIGV